MSRRLILIRHGQTTYNATGRMQGHLDTQLSDEGVVQAESAGRLLQNQGITRILASDLSRAKVTAEIVGKQLGLDVEVDERMRETNLGQWQGMTSAEVDEQYPGARAIWRHDPTWAPPEGESRVDVAKRARPVIDEFMESYSDWDTNTVLVVAHGGAIAALTCNLIALHNQQYQMLSGLKNTHWAQLTARPAFDPARPDAPVSFNEDNIANANWYFDGWNMGARVVGGTGADI
ncbi:histidine phosphatase family protein [Corynebacterium casei]|uniref:histidine phosphatase family protein n=1 Tax=Corynebacterium casei TaxID=160386 RepID=UPI0026471017|nr:histidine phosphatase family protein [Corynebacterium casei]MDN6286521.1 histidine phosphatase family protein [Corynebacterium casei]MDN6313648.1 histidine phosphatase family protein [Corynebacterium casei]MDN6371253.1 histidine phosphatase family protein [Corynebacterium casei]